MIISLKLKNWLYFENDTTISFNHENSISDPFTIMPIGIITGNTGAGKADVIKSLKFLKDSVIKYDSPLNRLFLNTNIPNCYLNDCSPAVIDLTFLAKNGVVYNLYIALTRSTVISEYVRILDGRDNELLYYRNFTSKTILGDRLKYDENAKACTVIVEDNQLLLGLLCSKTPKLRDIKKWFQDQLIIYDIDKLQNNKPILISPPIRHETELFKLLIKLGINIRKLDIISAPSNSISDELRYEINNILHNKESLMLRVNESYFIIKKDKHSLNIYKIILYHDTDCKFPCELSQEPYDVRYLLNILPIFINLSKATSDKICIIEEFTNNLDYSLINKLLKLCVKRNTTSQFIFSTTNDVDYLQHSLNKNILDRSNIYQCKWIE